MKTETLHYPGSFSEERVIRACDEWFRITARATDRRGKKLRNPKIEKMAAQAIRGRQTWVVTVTYEIWEPTCTCGEKHGDA